MTISSSSLNKLTLAKQMFILGKSMMRKNTRMDRILSILNFDFCVVTIIAVTSIDSGNNPKKKNGKAKNWEELLNILRTLYNNQVTIADLDSLHDLRNSVQHGDTIPSEWDVERFEKIVKEFFDDVCFTIYENLITFDSISMANVVKSKHEKILLNHMENEILSGNYNVAYLFLFSLLIYHYMLIRTNLKLPLNKPNLAEFNPEEITDKVARTNIENIFDHMRVAIDRLSIGEYYLRTLELLKKASTRVSLEFAYDSLSKLEPLSDTEYAQIEEDKITLYGIIFGTEHIITEKEIVDVPIIYGAHATEITSYGAKIKYGVMSKLKIKESTMNLYADWNEENLEQKVKLNNFDGYDELILDNLQPNTKYLCKIFATQEKDPEYMNHNSVNDAEIKFTTKS